MKYLIFNSKKDYDDYEAVAYAAWIADHPDEPYRSQTTRWTNETTRKTDNKRVARQCPSVQDHSSYTVEDDQGQDWFGDNDEQ